MSEKVIQFASQSITCEGTLHLPVGFDAQHKYPALVIGHGFTVSRSSLVQEARLFAEAGYITLAIDYRHFGTSGGEPRGRLWPMQEVEDFRAAIDWLETQPGVDPTRIGIWGTSFGGGIVTHVAAHDIRVRACVAQAPILDGDFWIRSLNRETDYLAVRKYLLAARRKRLVEGGDPTMPMGAQPEDGFMPMPADPAMIEDVMGWYQKTGDMLMHSAPEITIESFEQVMQFDATYTARKIAPRAYCIVQLTGHDVYHPNEPIQTAYRVAGEPKRMVSLKMDQLDAYKPGFREQAIGAAAAFFDEYLA
ncbi:alpha/beta hydrolase [Novosphingobium ginsenosidimutans]|uniref:Alpha/beta fold hydrolase n=1 Tax=Novosphingobium ginsenosidimutans TaxID=1176536 RepID=A0A5B8S7U1_9SPHN|nr:alpha/beta fold hydrolase [Novosphingobium ginsenosidimutans]QEA17032.1 alpha/beta fold hydrolase [Novosphingobium ginsenosidimutans]